MFFFVSFSFHTRIKLGMSSSKCPQFQLRLIFILSLLMYLNGIPRTQWQMNQVINIIKARKLEAKKQSEQPALEGNAINLWKSLHAIQGYCSCLSTRRFLFTKFWIGRRCFICCNFTSTPWYDLFKTTFWDKYGVQKPGLLRDTCLQNASTYDINSDNELQRKIVQQFN